MSCVDGVFGYEYVEDDPSACPKGSYSGAIKENGIIVMFVDGLSSHSLHSAVSENRFDCVERDLKNGVDIDIRDGGYTGRGSSPLFYAENLEMVKFLLDRGADINFKNRDGETFLHKTDNKEIAEFLISQGLNVNEKNNEGVTPLGAAGLKGNLEFMEVLVMNGSQVDTSVLNDVISHSRYDRNFDTDLLVVEFFFKNGVQINAKDKAGFTPLHYAVANEMNPNFLNILIQKKADLNIKNNEDDTPLFVAMYSFIIDEDEAEEEIENIFKPLLEAGADPNIKNGNGMTVLDIAEDEGNEELIKLLRSYNAKTSREIGNWFDKTLRSFKRFFIQ